MSALRMASSVFCDPLPTHLVQPPLIPKRIRAASASTTTGISFLRHPLLVNTLSLTVGVVFDTGSTAGTACFVSAAMFTCPLPALFQTPPSLSRTQATPVGIHDSLQQAMPETEARLTAKQPGTCNDPC